MSEYSVKLKKTYNVKFLLHIMILLNLTNKIVKEVDILARLCYDMTFTLLDKGFMTDNITISTSKFILFYEKYNFS